MAIEMSKHVEEWRNKLLDLSKRNRLINCKLGPRAALEIVHPDCHSLWQALVAEGEALTFVRKDELLGISRRKARDVSQVPGELGAGDESAPEPASERMPSIEQCLASSRLSSDHLLTPLDDGKLTSRLKQLALNAKTALDEQGVNVLFAAFGMLKWYEADSSDIPLYSPLLLVPVALERPSLEAPWRLNPCEDDVIPNQCLAESLRTYHRIEIPAITAEGSAENLELTDYFAAVRQALSTAEAAKRWEVLDIAAVSTFSFQKVAVWQDLGKNSERIGQHALCRMIAGDSVTDLGGQANGIPMNEFDQRIRPSDMHSILECDSSQMAAILSAKGGVNLVLDGPPGTGKSQTIANIIAECLAMKKTVLFVSEKAAALEVVKRRLDINRLGDFCLECHSHKANKKQIVTELERCLGLPVEAYQDQSRSLEELYAARTALNAYAQAVHQAREPLGITPYQAHAQLAASQSARVSRCSIPDILKVDAPRLQTIRSHLESLKRNQAVLKEYHTSPWRGLKLSRFSLSLPDEIRHDLESLANLTEAAQPPLALLARYGFLDAQAGRKAVAPGLAAVTAMLSLPPIPAEWSSQDLQLHAGRVLAYDKRRRIYRDNWQRLPQFKPSALDLKVEGVEEQFRKCQSYLQWLRNADTDSLRGLESNLQVALDGIAKLTTLADKINVAAAELLRHLPFVKNATLSTLGRLSLVAKILADTGPLKAEWFDDRWRNTLLPIAAQCTKDLDACDRIREARAEQWSFLAFEEEGRSLSDRLDEFSSLPRWVWAWITGSWSAFCVQLRPLYQEAMPTGRQALLNDLTQLREFHQRMGRVNAAASRHAAHLLSDATGNPDWRTFDAGIEAIDRLKAVLKNPERLKSLLCDEQKLDRAGLRTAAVAVEKELEEFTACASSLDAVFVIQAANEPPYRELTPAAVVDRLSLMQTHLQDALIPLAAIRAVLADGQDMPPADVPRYCKALLQMRRQRDELGQLVKELLPNNADQGNPALPTEWIRAAQELIAFSERHGAHLLQSSRECLTSAESRHEIEAAAGVLTTFDRSPLWEKLAACFPLDQPVSGGIVIDSADLTELVRWLRSMSQATVELPAWLSFRESEQALTDLGLSQVFDEVLHGSIDPNEVVESFVTRFYRLWLDAVYQGDNVLRTFRVEDHESLIERFRELDRKCIQGGARRVRQQLLAEPDRPRINAQNVPASSELGILLKEAQKKRRQIPLRQLFRRIPNILPRVKPCLMMSPLAVSTFLDAPEYEFDVVIFDEGSQVRPFDAIGAVYRGRQLIVAGDQKQMPPTSFFDRMESDDEELDQDEEDTYQTRLADFESILDVCVSMGISRSRLRWHYRSRRESLIAFSNRYFYDNDLVTFPSVLDGETSWAVQLHHIENGQWIPGTGGGYNAAEAKATATLILQHCEAYPDRSLGVITLNQRQQSAVLDELEQLRSSRPDLEHFFSEDKQEPFFVKNLENVQGDERDDIFLSIGYGYDANQKFALRFGPLNQDGGQRRLNVAVTRARQSMHVVSSIRAEDIDLGRAKSSGARLLRSFLDFAARGPVAIREQVTEDGDGENESEFEAAVERGLRARGLDVRRQIGCSGFRIDLAVVHPDHPSRFILGVECDGATYHRSATARDRDRLRQEILEGLGWTICRIWSTDWIRDPERQVQRVVAMYEEQLAKGENAEFTLTSSVKPRDEELEKPRILPPARSVNGNGARNAPASIDEVPLQVLCGQLMDALDRCGAMTHDDLVKTVAAGLGYGRTGKKIRERIEQAIAKLHRQRELQTREDGLLSR